MFRRPNNTTTPNKEMAMTSNSLRLCIYLGAVWVTTMFVGLWPLAQMFPPLDPAMARADVAAYYRDHQTGIIAGGMFIMISSAFFLPFASAIAAFMKRIEGTIAPLANTFSMLSAVLSITIFMSGVFFTAAAYRADFSDETVQVLSDLAFFMFLLPAIIVFVQLSTVGAAILGDRRAEPILPRWAGYLNLWTAVLTLPGAAVGLFKFGPFAWNGIIAFWLAMIVAGIWFNAMLWTMLMSVKRGALADA